MKTFFWSIKNSGEILDKLKARDFNATSLSTYDFSTLYTTLPHNLIKDKLIDLIERTFQREGSPYLACSDRNAFFTSEKPKKYHAWSCQNVCDSLTFLLVHDKYCFHLKCLLYVRHFLSMGMPRYTRAFHKIYLNIKMSDLDLKMKYFGGVLSIYDRDIYKLNNTASNLKQVK